MVCLDYTYYFYKQPVYNQLASDNKLQATFRAQPFFTNQQ